MNYRRYILWGVTLWMISGFPLVQAQRLDPTPGQSLFTVRGYAHSGLELRKFEGKPLNSSFVGGSFNPIFLWRQSDRLLFEGELGVAFDEGEVTFDLEYANVAYKLTNRITARIGQFLLPFGIFVPNLHPAWINRLPTAPLGFDHHNPVGPTVDFGFELRGAFPLGEGRLTYAVYVTNGPALVAGEDNPAEAGRLIFSQVEDNNSNKAIGGRISVLPFSNLSLEIGLSGQYARVGTDGSEYEKVAARMYSVDVNLIRTLPALQSVLNIKGQYNNVQVDRATYTFTASGVGPPTSLTFDNTSWAYFLQASLQPSFVPHALLRHLELVGRVSEMELAPEAPWGTRQREYAIGLNYWIDWRTVVKFSYLIINPVEAHDEEGEGLLKTETVAEEHEEGFFRNAFMIHIAIGF